MYTEHRVGFTCGAFDLLHPGHLHLLEHCKRDCDELIVGLHTDPSIERSEKNKPIQTTFERYQQLMACRYVSMVIPYDTEQDLCNMLAVLPITVRYVGSDYTEKLVDGLVTGWSVCQNRDIPILTITRIHDYSSSELRSRFK
jgi:glycerol-3-phosphate cytidylyltransferase